MTESAVHAISFAHLHALHAAISSKLPPILHTYISNSAINLEKLSDAFSVQDWSQLDKECHRLKGSSGNIGAVKLPSLCQQMQNELQTTKNTHQMTQILSMIQRENSAIIADLQTFLDSL
jgi:HPt (histidine-containing phosphotransfer) domain-containing protein